MTHPPLGGIVTPADGLALTRMGYGTMRLSGPDIMGPPKDHDEAVAVLRAAVEAGVRHLDTSDFYGPVTVNELVREALHPYPDDLHIITKVGVRRDERGRWNPSQAPADLQRQVFDNLEHLGLETLDAVNLRIPDGEAGASIADRFAALAELQQDGAIRHLGLSNINDAQLTEAQGIAPVVTVQNEYNLAKRSSDALVDRCERENIAFAPFFPLGGFSPLQSDALSGVARDLDASPQQVALAWLLQRSATIVVIPGTSSLAHLRENLAAADLVLDADAVAALDGIG